MTRVNTDILVAGGGVAGLVAAAAFGAAGFRVICVDPAPPVVSETAVGADLRSTAFLQPSQAFLQKIGLWQRLAPHASALQVMRIVDAGGAEAQARSVHEFDASDISQDPFGWNLPNWLIRREVLARISEMEQVELRIGVGAARLLTREREALVGLSDGTQVAARLVIAADGRNSTLREAAEIGVKTTRYGQKALVFVVTHEHPHEATSTEIHRSGGPFTLVPMPDLDGKPCSSIVWMERGAEAVRLAGLEKTAFEAACLERSAGLYGALQLVSPVSLWPIISQIASRMTAERLALVAEAAHVVPPIGAQGLNMSLGDLRALLELAEAAPDAVGGREMLARFERARHRDIALRVAGIDALNRASMAQAQGVRDMRMQALRALYGIAPVRRSLMRAGLGLR